MEIPEEEMKRYTDLCVSQRSPPSELAGARAEGDLRIPPLSWPEKEGIGEHVAISRNRFLSPRCLLDLIRDSVT